MEEDGSKNRWPQRGIARYNKLAMTEYSTHHFQATSSYTVSVGYDKRLYPYDIDGSLAHARMLGHQGIISQGDAGAIVSGLEAVRREIETGLFPWRDDLEDLHMNIEVRLHELIGQPASRLHTARSRNDQVATATRMFVRDAVASMQAGLRGVQDALLGIAERHEGALMPGYTHLQRAQPVLFAHHMLARHTPTRPRIRHTKCATTILWPRTQPLPSLPTTWSNTFASAS